MSKTHLLILIYISIAKKYNCINAPTNHDNHFLNASSDTTSDDFKNNSDFNQTNKYMMTQSNNSNITKYNALNMH